MINLKKLLLLVVLAFISYSHAQEFVKPDNTRINYTGRVDVTADSTMFYWPGTTAGITFKGSGVSVKMKSFKEKAFFYAIIDKDDKKPFKFETDNTLRTINIAKDLGPGIHTLEIYKLSNSTSVNVFYGFELYGQTQLLKNPDKRTRKIEFYGNSITAGHGVDVPEGGSDSGLPEDFNNYYTYAAITARHYNAKPSIIARSGIGIMVSWFAEIMPETYDRTAPLDSSSKWDFNKYTPDIVVINLFQNDSWIVNRPEFEQFKRRFGSEKPSEAFVIQSYANFVRSVRNKYPSASIICVLGNMDATRTGSEWPGYIQKAVDQLNDKKTYTLFFPYKERGNHPDRKEQEAMSKQLIEFIDRSIKW